jgi:hypothetical protein
VTRLERKISGICTRPGCTAQHGEATVLCDEHAAYAAKHERDRKAAERAERRLGGLCAECGLVRCRTYRCLLCSLRRKVGVIDPVAVSA